MDWSNERYVRLYTRDTKTWKLLGFEGQAVLSLALRKLDRAGVLDDVHNAEDLAVMIGGPIEVVEVGLGRIMKHGVLVDTERGLVAPNFIEAQEAAQSDRQRSKEARGRKRDRALAPRLSTASTETVTDCDDMRVTERDANVTRCHEPSQRVTARHSVPNYASLEGSDPSDPDPHLRSDPVDLFPGSRSGDQPVRSGSRAKGRPRTVKHQIPDEWVPSEAHRSEAAQLGVKCELEAQKFRDWCQANAKAFADFEAAFRNWIRRSAEFQRRGSAGGSARESRADFQLRRQMERVKQLELEERDIKDLEAVL